MKAAAVVLCMFMFGLAGAAYAMEDDPAMSFTAPAASLTIPYDVTNDDDGNPRVSFVRVSNIGCVSPDDALGRVPQCSVHVAAWDETCNHVVNLDVCLTLNSTIVLDTTSMQAAIFDPALGVVSVGPTFNLTGRRGVMTFTAYATNRDCISGSLLGDLLVDDGLMGSWAVSNIGNSATFGGNAWGHGLDESGTYVEVIEPGFDLNTIYLGTYDPDTVDSLVFGFGMRENEGKRGGELGPISDTVSADSSICVPTEICASRPDVRASCFFVSQLNDDQLENIGTSGFFTLSSVETEDDSGAAVPVGAISNAPGEATMVYAVNGEQLVPRDAEGNQVGGALGTDTAAYYTLGQFIPPPPTPTPEPTPEPTAITCGAGEFEVKTPIEGKVIGCCPDGSSAIVDGSTFIGCQLPAPPTPTPTPVLIPVPTVTTVFVTPSPAPTPTP